MTVMETRRYDLPVAATLRLQSRSAKVHVIAEGRDDVEAETDELEAFAEDGGRTLLIRSARGGSKPLTVRCPLETDVMVGTQAGNVKVEGRAGAVHVTTMSGSIEVESADEADLRTMSGNVEVGACRGACRASAISGRVTVGDAEATRASTVSGSIKIDRVSGDVKVRSVSGSIDMKASGDSPIAVKTVSGRVQIELPKDCEPQTFFKTRGRVTCDFPRGHDCRIEAASLSGSIEIVPA
jgi:DUF4097 and DUF4098 domain-containing protein YvlB